MKVVLASSSKFRKQLLDKLNISFKCISPDIDEKRLNNEDVKDYVKRLSIEKASKIACSNHKSIIIGSDEVADLKGKIIGKPITKKNAKKQLRMLSGNKVVFRTGLCVLNSETGKYYASVNNYNIFFKDLDDNIINKYLESDDVLNCAASIRIEGLAINLVRKMNGADPSSIMGLPLIKLIDYLARFDIDIMTK
ncbi:MAG: septum formation protein Maf [Porticoccus sp.]|nr:septum formation protein Maf [Porticoccus sp.]|tara:strand:+ start:871 stop:1452 length:582 start_codon:yes stop_codon:yes gene_type:complete